MNNQQRCLGISAALSVFILSLLPSPALTQSPDGLSLNPAGHTPVLAALEWVAQELLEPRGLRLTPLPVEFSADLSTAELARMGESPVQVRDVPQAVSCVHRGESMPQCTTLADPYALRVGPVEYREVDSASITLGVVIRERRSDGKLLQIFTQTLHDLALKRVDGRWHVMGRKVQSSAFYIMYEPNKN